MRLICPGDRDDWDNLIFSEPVLIITSDANQVIFLEFQETDIDSFLFLLEQNFSPVNLKGKG